MIFILVGCPYEVRVMSSFDTDDTKGALKVHSDAYGTYKIQTGTISGRDWYKKGDNAIWYHGGKGQWIVGDAEEKGTDDGLFYTFSDDKCPHQPSFNWRYWASAIDIWVDAGRSMRIWCVISGAGEWDWAYC